MTIFKEFIYFIIILNLAIIYWIFAKFERKEVK